MIFVILLCSLFFSSEAAVCTGNVEIRNSTYGTISPTTGENYPPNTDCSWTIYPTTATQTPSIYFDPALFNVSTGDYVTISFNQIQQVEIGNGVAPPFRFMYGPLGGTIKLEFKSDADANTQTGFTAVYRIHYCNGNTQINDNTGSFTDGSGDTTNYQDWSECGWVIRGVPGERTVLRFDKFATEYNYDFVTIYDGADKTAPVLGQFSGNTVPPQVIGSIGTPMYVYFESDMTNNDAGFIASFARTANQTIGPQRSNNCTTYTASDLPILIPPGNATTGDTISTILVSDSFTVGDVSVLNIQGNHTWMGDLNMYLTGPDGISISQLVNRRCNGYPGFAFSFSDLAMTSSWPCPPTGGEWQPFTPLAVFNNKNSMGSWRLRVQDMEAGDNGELKGWQLRLCTPVASPAPVTSGANAPITSGMTETHSEGTTGGESASQSDMTTGMTETHSEGTTGRSQQTPSTTGSRPAAVTTGFDLPVQLTGDHHVDSVASGLPTKVYVAFVCILVVFFMRYM